MKLTHIGCASGDVRIGVDETGTDLVVREFQYKGHDYIGFNLGLNSAGYVHSPDCAKCKAEQ